MATPDTSENSRLNQAAEASNGKRDDDGGGHKKLSKADVVVGTVILISAQLAAASTASCVHALPAETPMVLRGLWRQTLTSMIFAVLTLLFVYRRGNEGNNQDSSEDCANEIGSEEGPLLASQKTESTRSIESKDDPHGNVSAASARIALVALAVIGATLLNDTIVVALGYASSAAVMCLCNTTPIWLILYAIVYWGAQTPGVVTIIGAGLSLVGAIVCATGEDGSDGGDGHKNESLGAIIATIGGMGGAMYMTACRKLHPVGIHPILLTLIINVGMTIASLLLCLATLESGIAFFSMDVSNGFFGFLNSEANPAAALHSIFPDLGGNFGIMIALSYFEPLIVSMVMLAEPLNASLIAMNVVGEAPPSRRTIIGVAIVLAGCAVVLWESSKEGRESAEIERQESAAPGVEPEKRMSALYHRRTSQVILMSPIGTIAPDATAKAAFRRPNHIAASRRTTLPSSLERYTLLSLAQREESERFRSSSSSNPNDSTRRMTLTSSITRNLMQRLSLARSMVSSGEDVEPGRQSSKWNFFRASAADGYGSVVEEDEEAEQELESG